MAKTPRFPVLSSLIEEQLVANKHNRATLSYLDTDASTSSLDDDFGQSGSRYIWSTDSQSLLDENEQEEPWRLSVAPRRLSLSEISSSPVLNTPEYDSGSEGGNSPVANSTEDDFGSESGMVDRSNRF